MTIAQNRRVETPHFRPMSDPGGPPSRRLLVNADDVALIRESLAPGSETPAHRHPVEQCVFVERGTLELRLGADRLVLEPERLALIPAGFPHALRNVGDDVSVYLDVYLPAPAPGTAAGEPCALGTSPAPGGTVRAVSEGGFTFPKEGDAGLAVHWLARRESGSRAAINVIRSQPGSGSPPLHIHDFVQIYVQLAGNLTARVAGTEYVLETGDVVVIPPGVPHEQLNAGNQVERHFTVNSTEPLVSMSGWDSPVEFRRL